MVIAHKRSARSIADIIFFKSVGRHLTVVLVVAINLINTYHDQDYAGPVSLKKLGEYVSHVNGPFEKCEISEL